MNINPERTGNTENLEGTGNTENHSVKMLLRNSGASASYFLIKYLKNIFFDTVNDY